MKKLLAVSIFIIILTTSLIACGNSSINRTLGEPEQRGQTGNNDSQAASSKVDMFIEEYNAAAPNPIIDTTVVDVTDTESGHYRTEFRLNAFSDSYAKTGKIGDIVIDIVCYGKDNNDIRVYTDNIGLESAKEIIRVALPILDSDLSSADIQEVLDYLDEYKEANGYYCGDVGIVYLDDLMLKAE